jgi:hypothetical protein
MNSAQDTLAGGLPHSEIPGSPIARIFPGLFAACHVLHRLSVPRHPPDALVSRLITASPSPAMPHHRRAQGQAPTAAQVCSRRTRRSRMKTLLSDKPRAMHCRHKACPPRSHHNSLLTLQSTAPRSPAAVSRQSSPNVAHTPACGAARCTARRRPPHGLPAAPLGGAGGGGERSRTDDLLLAKQALSQLSYTPRRMVGQGGFEPPTSRLSSARSNQLSY